ncbi:hypothetical protein MKW98_029116 [Papaver atlanticum]|uniref:Uncharacterized protein n=1 Tax=Papaver atlanticum TaxID=357466 RepID=A0AAD4SBM8_9MAGN|nr:hypothetical protein MKW98_029116 [Papaver atlanticum]
MPVAVGLSFYCGYDFKGLWFGLLAAESSCAVLLLIVLGRTDCELQAIRAKELTKNSSVLGDNDDDDTNDIVKETREEEKKTMTYDIKKDLSTPLITNKHDQLSLV